MAGRDLSVTGVPAVVGSLWDVEDATAKELLVSFHRLYGQKGLDAAAAMQAAQLEMLRRNTKRGDRPVWVWAPFEVIGYASVLFRAECFNVASRANLGLPNPIVFSGNSISPSAGKITSTTTSSRQIQFGLKLMF